MEIQQRNTVIGAGVGAGAGIVSGLIADKLTNPAKFVSNFQTSLINKKIAKDVFNKSTKGNMINVAQGAIDNSEQFIKNAKTNGIKNFASRWGFAFEEGKTTAKELVDQLKSKQDIAKDSFAKMFKKCRKGNLIAAGVAAGVAAGALIGKLISSKKAEKTEA